VGPTAMQEINTLKKNDDVHVYSSNEKIYIRNTSNESIKNVSVFNIIGQEIYRNNAPENKLNQIAIKGNTGYYIVHVTTDQSMVFEKVFIYN
jgi:hypothetical protein